MWIKNNDYACFGLILSWVTVFNFICIYRVLTFRLLISEPAGCYQTTYWYFQTLCHAEYQTAGL